MLPETMRFHTSPPTFRYLFAVDVSKAIDPLGAEIPDGFELTFNS
jgi:hypothetical protein